MNDQTNETVPFQTSLSAISGFLLSNIRDQMGVNQREISRIFDISHVTYGSMEKGETAINSDFIYMLCSLLNIKFSDYFELIEDIVKELTLATTCTLYNNIQVSLIPSSDILKLMQETNGRVAEGVSKSQGSTNLIIGQSFKFFLSPEMTSRISVLSRTRLTKEQIKELTAINTVDLEELENKQLAWIGGESLAIGGSGMASGYASAGLAMVLGLHVVPTVVGLVGLGGYELFKSYKKNKEDKKKN